MIDDGGQRADNRRHMTEGIGGTLKAESSRLKADS
jgi:hypothetical protein